MLKKLPANTPDETNGQRQDKTDKAEIHIGDIDCEIMRAGVPKAFRKWKLEDFETTGAPMLVSWPKNGCGGYCLRGKTGTGKSCLAAALVRNWIIAKRGAGLNAEWISLMLFIERVKSATHPQSKERPYDLLISLRNKKLIIVDDLGRERQHDWDKEIMSCLLWQAVENEQDLIVTTNRTLEEIEYIDEALASRLSTLQELPLFERDMRQKINAE